MTDPGVLLDAGSLAVLLGIFRRLGSLRSDVDALRRRVSRVEDRV